MAALTAHGLPRGRSPTGEHEGIEPDLMTVANGLTAGYVPMDAVVVGPVYQVIATLCPTAHCSVTASPTPAIR
jgi:adenosylmethionine-8-amino-7-oxononanoate aminotransferase